MDESCAGEDDAGEGREEVEETIGKIGEGGHAENGALHETAGVPRNKDASDGGSVLACAAEETRLVTALTIDILEHGTGKDYAKELVGKGDVAEDAGEDG